MKRVIACLLTICLLVDANAQAFMPTAWGQASPVRMTQAEAFSSEAIPPAVMSGRLDLLLKEHAPWIIEGMIAKEAKEIHRKTEGHATFKTAIKLLVLAGVGGFLWEHPTILPEYWNSITGGINFISSIPDMIDGIFKHLTLPATRLGGGFADIGQGLAGIPTSVIHGIISVGKASYGIQLGILGPLILLAFRRAGLFLERIQPYAGTKEAQRRRPSSRWENVAWLSLGAIFIIGILPTDLLKYVLSSVHHLMSTVVTPSSSIGHLLFGTAIIGPSFGQLRRANPLTTSA